MRLDAHDGEPLDAEARRALDTRLAQIRHDAHANPRSGRLLRPAQTEIYVHFTDHTLATGTGVLRVEDIGPLIASQLSELIGHGPYTVKPVIDLNDAISVDAYEIPDRIRERVKLPHPIELFPYGTRETHKAMDLDHIQPYNPLGPPAQTNTQNLAPLRRFTHRIKTHAPGWNAQRLDRKTLEWTTPHGLPSTSPPPAPPEQTTPSTPTHPLRRRWHRKPTRLADLADVPREVPTYTAANGGRGGPRYLWRARSSSGRLRADRRTWASGRRHGLHPRHWR